MTGPGVADAATGIASTGAATTNAASAEGTRTAARAASAGGRPAPRRRDLHTAFDTMHPVVPAVYLLITLVLVMSCMQPVLIVLALTGALAYNCRARGPAATARSLRWQVPIILLAAALNPLFSASGSTELFRLGVRAVYLESVCYGCAMGALFVASVLWFQAASTLLPLDKVMALLGNAAPVIALMTSMCMRMIPRFVRQGRQVLDVQRASGVDDGLRLRLRMSTVLMGWSLEDSLETADAMRARGWGAAPRRTTYTRYRLSGADILAAALLAAAGVACGALGAVATSQFSFFPQMSGLVVWWGYVPYALWMLVPVVGHVVEERRFG